MTKVLIRLTDAHAGLHLCCRMVQNHDFLWSCAYDGVFLSKAAKKI